MEWRRGGPRQGQGQEVASGIWLAHALAGLPCSGPRHGRPVSQSAPSTEQAGRGAVACSTRPFGQDRRDQTDRSW